jgi:hypothetical protein
MRFTSVLRRVLPPAFLALPACPSKPAPSPAEAPRDAAGVEPQSAVAIPRETPDVQEEPSAKAGASKVRSAPSTIWVGESGGVRVEWTTRGIVTRPPESRPIDLFDRPTSEPGCEGELGLRLLSVVGSIVSYELSEGTTCENAAHPSAITLYAAVDAAHPAQKVRLTDLFADSDVLRALMADAVVKRHLPKTPPKTTDALVQALAESNPECEYSFGPDLPTRFAFHHLEGSRVAVRIGLSHGCEVARGKLTQLGILLPVPPSWKDALERANARTEGFLMRDEQAVSGGKETSLHF